MENLHTIDYRAIFEQTSSPHLLLKPDAPDYTIIGVNEAYLKATMTTREKIIGKKMFQIFPDNPSEQRASGVHNLRESFDNVVENRIADTMAVQKYDIRRPDGTWEERWWIPVNSPVFVSDGTMICIIHHVVDVTQFFQVKNSKGEAIHSQEAQAKLDVTEAEVYQHGQEIQEINRQLRLYHDKLNSLYKECQKTSKELKRSNTELEQFAYFVSHDLQEPLRAVVGFLSFLKQDLGDAVNENALDDIREAVAGTHRMQTIIQDLLSYSRVNTRGAEFEPVDMKAAVDIAIDSLHAVINECDARIIVETLPTVFADRTQMSLLFQNLIGNAIKFRGQRRPQIHLFAKHEANEWIFSVADNGIGIEPQFKDTVFQIFQRLHTREEYPGTGIGLAVCKRIVERHGGRIWVESKVGEGAIFSFTIPDKGKQ